MLVYKHCDTQKHRDKYQKIRVIILFLFFGASFCFCVAVECVDCDFRCNERPTKEKTTYHRVLSRIFTPFYCKLLAVECVAFSCAKVLPTVTEPIHRTIQSAGWLTRPAQNIPRDCKFRKKKTKKKECANNFLTVKMDHFYAHSGTAASAPHANRMLLQLLAVNKQELLPIK